jgi:hypothetical protein
LFSHPSFFLNQTLIKKVQYENRLLNKQKYLLNYDIEIDKKLKIIGAQIETITYLSQSLTLLQINTIELMEEELTSFPSEHCNLQRFDIFGSTGQLIVWYLHYPI